MCEIINKKPKTVSDIEQEQKTNMKIYQLSSKFRNSKVQQWHTTIYGDWADELLKRKKETFN